MNKQYKVGDTVFFNSQPCIILEIAKWNEIEEGSFILVGWALARPTTVFCRLLRGDRRNEWIVEHYLHSETRKDLYSARFGGSARKGIEVK